MTQFFRTLKRSKKTNDTAGASIDENDPWNIKRESYRVNKTNGDYSTSFEPLNVNFEMHFLVGIQKLGFLDRY